MRKVKDFRLALSRLASSFNCNGFFPYIAAKSLIVTRAGAKIKLTPEYGNRRIIEWTAPRAAFCESSFRLLAGLRPERVGQFVANLLFCLVGFAVFDSSSRRDFAVD